MDSNISNQEQAVSNQVAEKKKSLNPIRKYWLLVFLAFLATVLLVIKLFFGAKPEAPTTTTVPQATWKGVTPGRSTPADVYKTLGEPKSTADNNSRLFYLREGGGPPHEVFLQENTVGLIKERSLAGNLADFKKRYGAPEGEFFGPNKGVGYKMYVWAKNGVAVNAHQLDGGIFEVWYFSPTTLQQFLSTWGKDLTIEETHQGY